MPIRFLNTVDLTVTSSILKTDANGVIVAAVAGTDYINTVTSAMVTTALGYTPVPTTRTLTINGTAFDLSANRTWTITTITGNAGSATVLQTARTLTIGNTGKTFNGSADVSWTLAEIGAYAATNPSGYITSSGNISGYAGSLEREDNRTISPSELTAGRLKFGFTSWANNNTAPYADFLHLRSYTDASGGNDNLVMFRKDAIGMRVWQQAWGSTTAYSSFKDVAFTDSSITGNAGSATVLQTARTINGTSFNGSANITTSFWGTARTITIGNTGKSVNGSANVSWTLAEIGAQAALTNPVTGTGTTNYLPKFTGATTIGNSQVFDNGTNVGIGTTSPTSKLQVGVGTSNTPSPVASLGGALSGILSALSLVNTSGNAAAGYGTALDFHVNSGYSPTGRISTIAENTSTESALALYTYNGGLNEKLRITSAGNVGIGTTAPTAKLHVQGSSPSVLVYSDTTTGGKIDFVDQAWQSQIVGTGGNLLFNTGGTSERMRITSAGNVGIGTTAPGYKLHVVGDVLSSGSFRLEGGGATTTFISESWGINLNGDATHPVQVANASFGVGYSLGSGTNYGSGNMYVAGNVGIGTTAPAKKLHVYNSSPNQGLRTSNIDGINMDVLAGANGGLVGTYSNHPLSFVTNSTEYARISNTGNLGIGTTAPLQKLHISAGSSVIENTYAYWMNGSDYNWGIGRNIVADTGFLTGNTLQAKIFNGTTQGFQVVNSSNSALFEVEGNTGRARVIGGFAVGSITPSTTAGRIDASNDIVAFSTSDLRFKENITPIANALDKVKTLTGVEFDWKKETKDYHGYVGHDVGVIAQDVQAVLPEAVRTNANGYLSVRYEKMIALLVEANKELAARVEELEKKLK